MEILRQLVQSLIIIVMLAVFLELLLPSGTMQGYVKMVMGLLVVIAVLQVVFDFFHTDFYLHVPKLSSTPSAALEQVQANAKELSEHYQNRALEDYRSGIAKQVLALARLNRELAVLDARVDLNTSRGENFGRLQLIQLTVTDKPQTEQGAGKIKPVEIQVGADGGDSYQQGQVTEEKQQAMDKLAKTVANFYNLPPEQVQVIYTN
ncbi:stage III sporulation protein AF [Desulfohalotomaculum tongense]|uniref:stage III sporulation protein AF n=1 Tax=Desulforadius tongensis TaxID=1216062 RepID=UPI001958C197|nr:stage III sporulation protein AF [Desulforadius tongensis]